MYITGSPDDGLGCPNTVRLSMDPENHFCYPGLDQYVLVK